MFMTLKFTCSVDTCLEFPTTHRTPPFRCSLGTSPHAQSQNHLFLKLDPSAVFSISLKTPTPMQSPECNNLNRASDPSLHLSPLQSCLVKGGFHSTQIPYIKSSSSHTQTHVVNTLPSTWHLCGPFSQQWSLTKGILPSRECLVMSRNIFVTTGVLATGLQLVEARDADKHFRMHRTVPTPPPTWNYTVHNINDAIADKLKAA